MITAKENGNVMSGSDLIALAVASCERLRIAPTDGAILTYIRAQHDLSTLKFTQCDNRINTTNRNRKCTRVSQEASR